MKNKYCENCKFYRHEPNIIGGITSCLLSVKYLTTFWRNNACEKYDEKKGEEISESQMGNRLSELLNQIK